MSAEQPNCLQILAVCSARDFVMTLPNLWPVRKSALMTESQFGHMAIPLRIQSPMMTPQHPSSCPSRTSLHQYASSSPPPWKRFPDSNTCMTYVFGPVTVLFGPNMISILYLAKLLSSSPITRSASLSGT